MRILMTLAKWRPIEKSMNYSSGTALIQIKPIVCDVLNNTMQHVLYICNQCFLQDFFFQIIQRLNMLNDNIFFSTHQYIFFNLLLLK